MFSVVPACTSFNPESSATLSATTDTTTIHTKPLWQPGCYLLIYKNDTARLNLHINDTVATGHLTCHRYEKDKNAGEIKGVIKDSILDAGYTFQPEGFAL